MSPLDRHRGDLEPLADGDARDGAIGVVQGIVCDDLAEWAALQQPGIELAVGEDDLARKLSANRYAYGRVRPCQS